MAEVFAISKAFRGARDSWWAARKTVLPGSMANNQIARVAAGKERRWTVSGARYLRAYKGLDGNLIKFPDELLELTSRLIEQVAPRLGTAFDRELGGLAFSAWRQWPVQTGLSRSLIDLEYEQNDLRFVGRLVARAPYVVFINKGQTLRDLIRGPGRGIARKIAADMREGQR